MATRKSSKKTVKLSLKTQEDAIRVSQSFRVLLTTDGWQNLVGIIENNIAALERMVMLKTDPTTGEKLTDVQVDECRMKWNYLNEIKETPQKFINALESPPEDSRPEYDPYFKSVDELIRSRKAR